MLFNCKQESAHPYKIREQQPIEKKKYALLGTPGCLRDGMMRSGKPQRNSSKSKISPSCRCPINQVKIKRANIFFITEIPVSWQGDYI
jgi:hypothetical protein